MKLTVNKEPKEYAGSIITFDAVAKLAGVESVKQPIVYSYEASNKHRVRALLYAKEKTTVTEGMAFTIIETPKA